METRRPKSEGRKKVEIRNPKRPRVRRSSDSGFGLRTSFGFRPSGFGFCSRDGLSNFRLSRLRTEPHTRRMPTHTQEPLLHLDLPGFNKLRSGKVRDIFDLGDRLLFVATDRISAFDCIMPNGIPRKGEVLTQISYFWF